MNRRKPAVDRTTGLKLQVHRIAKTLWYWDLLVAVLAAGATALILVKWTHDIALPSGVATAIIAFGLGITGIAFQQGKAVKDLLKGDYGRLVGVHDPGEDDVELPYLIGQVSGALTAILGLFCAASGAALTRGWLITLISVIALFALYDILAVISLIRWTRFHGKQEAELRHLKEEAEALARQSKRKNKADTNLPESRDDLKNGGTPRTQDGNTAN